MKNSQPSKPLLHTLLHSLPDGVLLVSEEGEVVYANPMAAALFGCRPDDLTGHLWGQPLAEGVTEIEITREDESPLAVEISGTQLDWEGQRYFLAGLRNISKRKAAYEKAVSLGKTLLEGYETLNRRIGKEIHDSLGQPLIGLKLALSRFSDGEDLHPQTKLEEVNQLIDGIIDSIRDLTHSLRPATQNDWGLEETLRNHLHRVQTQNGLIVNFHGCFTDSKLDPITETVAFRVVQEGIDNVIRHADVSEATVSVESPDHRLEITVEDCGRGFDPSAIEDKNTGLKAMRERIELAGGGLTVASALGKGTLIRATLPLAQEPD